MAESLAYFDTSLIAPPRSWLQRRNTSLRTLDALHLTIAAEHGRPILTADRQLHRAAEALGCKSHLPLWSTTETSQARHAACAHSH